MDDETPGHNSSRQESNISNNHVAAGRDIKITPYNVAGNFIQHMAIESNKEVLGSRANYIVSDDDVAAGMLIPAPPLCILERDSQHDHIIIKLLSFPNTRIALLGIGGIGKTTLACSIASDPQIEEAYPRRLFLSFEGCATPDLAYTNLATAFHIPVDRRSSHRQILSQVLNYLKREKTLFIMDNFETFWEIPGNRRAAEDLLAQLATLRELAFIATLRGIQRPGNIRWLKMDPLQTLTQDASMDLLSAITEEEYSESDLACIRKLLNAVAGIPLAVTFIGSLLRDESETPQSIWNYWTRESARAIRVVNVVDSDDRLYRLDISLRLSVLSPRMNENAKAILAAISILPTGMNMDEEWLYSFQNLLPSTVPVRDCIRTLRNVALAILDSYTSPPRLKLLPPVRDFCRINLPIDSEISRRLIDIYYTDSERHWNLALHQHYTWVTTELSNITAILDLAITLRYITEEFGCALLICSEWRSFLCIIDIEIIERALDVSDQPRVKTLCLQALGMAFLDSHRYTEAIQQLEQALSLQKEVGTKREMGWTLSLIGNAHKRLHNYANAEHALGVARDLYIETDDEWMNGSVSRILTDVYREQSKLAEAEHVGKEALELCRASGNQLEEGHVLRELGKVYRDQGKYDFALETLTSALNACELVHDTHAEALANQSLGVLYLYINKPNEAARHFRLAISLFERAQDPKEADGARLLLREVQD